MFGIWYIDFGCIGLEERRFKALFEEISKIREGEEIYEHKKME